MNNQYRLANVLFIILCSGFGGLLYGYDVGIYTDIFIVLKNNLHLTKGQLGIIGGAVFFGGIFGALFAGYTSDKLGRKLVIIFGSIFFILAGVCVLFANNFSWLLLVRMLAGIGLGIVSVATPNYLSEISPTHIRGAGVTTYMTFLTGGILLAYLIGFLLPADQYWHISYGLIGLFGIVLLFAISMLPESPRWLIEKNLYHKAESALKKIYPHYKEAMENIKSGCAEEVNFSSMAKISRKGKLFLILAFAAAMLDQLTGINVILQYAPVFLNKVLHTTQASLIETIIIGAMNFLATILGLILIDRLGRKLLLVIGNGGIVLSYLLLIAISIFKLPYGNYLTLVGLLLFIFFYAAGPSVVLMLIISELFPTKIRGTCIAISLALNALVASFISTCFLLVENKYGLISVYGIFAGFTLIYLLMIKVFLPETNQVDLEDIQVAGQA